MAFRHWFHDNYVFLFSDVHVFVDTQQNTRNLSDSFLKLFITVELFVTLLGVEFKTMETRENKQKCISD